MPASKIDFIPDEPMADTSTREKIEQLQTKVVLLEMDVQSLRQANIDEQYAVINPLSRDYKIWRTDNGIFYVSCDGAEPYPNGHKLKLRIGNPSNASFNGFKIKCEYGLKEPDYPSIEKSGCWRQNGSPTELVESKSNHGAKWRHRSRRSWLPVPGMMLN